MTTRSIRMTMAAALFGACLGGTRESHGQQAAPTLTPTTFEVSGVPLAAEEGWISVPARRGNPSSRQISLEFVRFRSTADAPGAPIVFLAGGPGDAGTRAVAGMPVNFLNELLAIADVIAFDQRGTGRSEPLDPVCPIMLDVPRDRPLDVDAVLDRLKRAVSECMAKADAEGVDIGGLTTEESADDLEALRVALGAERLSFLAGSYGTHLALAAARRHPALVDRMVLAGVEGPDHTLKLPSLVDEVLGAIAVQRRPELLDEIHTLRARLASEGARFTFPTGQVIVLGEWDLQRWIAESLDTVREIEMLLAALPRMLEGDFSMLAPSALRFRLAQPINLMNVAMDCASFASEERLARIQQEEETSLLGTAMNFPAPGICAVEGMPRLPDSYREMGRIDTPALLISGTFDGRTPPRNAEEMLLMMPGARHLVIDGASHGLFGEAAVLTALLDFMRE